MNNDLFGWPAPGVCVSLNFIIQTIQLVCLLPLIFRGIPIHTATQLQPTGIFIYKCIYISVCVFLKNILICQKILNKKYVLFDFISDLLVRSIWSQDGEWAY